MIKNNNPIILTIESSASTCGVAVSQSDVLLCEYNIFKPNQHDRMLAVLVERALSDLEIKINEVDCIAVSSGPGSFTGLRIGAALAKGICYEDIPKLIAVPTLEAIAYSLKNSAKSSGAKQILALSKSHKNFYYYQYFDLDTKPKNEVIFSELEQINIDAIENTFICGNYEDEQLFNLLKELNISNNKTFIQPHKGIFPAYIAKLAYVLYLDGKFTKSEDFTPIYIQDFQIKTTKNNEKKEYRR